MRLIDLGSIVVVLRLLSPEELGLASLAWSVTTVVEGLAGLGVGRALVQAPGLEREALPAIWTFCLVVSLALFALVCAGAPLVAWAYDAPGLTALLCVAAIKPLGVGLSHTPMGWVAKGLNYDRMSLVQLATTLVESGAKISLAWAGAGAWALVGASASRGVAIFVFASVAAGFVPRLRWCAPVIRPLVRFGWRVTLADLLSQATRNVDYFIVGRVFGVEALGMYRVAYEMAMVPLEAILQLNERIAYPLFAKLATDATELRAAFFDATRRMFLFALPLVGVVMSASPALVVLVTGESWTETAAVAQILALAALMRSLSHPFPLLFEAVGRPIAAAQLSLCSLLLISLCLLGLPLLLPASLGLVAVGWAWVLAALLILLASLALAHLQVPLPLRAWLRQVALTVLVGGVLLVAHQLLVASALARFESLASTPALALAGAIGLALIAYGLPACLHWRLLQRRSARRR